ncbi:MAG: VWA domain-containing protein [Candidatus Omnitrophica bacterium]|nr:VWA domain-containing protein [Candidatus Omnitrophota bacterium]
MIRFTWGWKTSSCGGRKAIILLTDGKDDDGTGAQLSRTPLNNAIMAAQRSHIPVFTIGLGEEISQSTLEKIADETGGEYLFAPNGADLDDLYSEIASELGRGDEGYYRLTYRATESHKDGSDRTIIIRYEDATAIATYPAPKNSGPSELPFQNLSQVAGSSRLRMSVFMTFTTMNTLNATIRNSNTVLRNMP